MTESDIAPLADLAPSSSVLNEGLPEGATFFFDPMHFPNPVPPLTLDIYRQPWTEGGARALRELGMPIRRWHAISRSHYLYFWQELDGIPDLAAIEDTLHSEATNLLERWNQEYLPEVLAIQARLQTLSGQVADSDDLKALIDRAFRAYADLWYIHFLIVGPMGMAMQLFDDFHRDVFGGDLESGHPLLAGQLSESVKAGFGLSDLASRARELGISETILDLNEDDALAALATTDAGLAFLTELDAYLDVYGLRQDLYDVAMPTWRERPAYAITYVRNYLRSSLDARAHHAKIAAAATEAQSQARSVLARYPQPMRDQFETLLSMAHAGSFLQEEHNFHIDQLGSANLHHFFVEVGKRLVRLDVIDAPDDVFLLSTAQLRSAIEAPISLRHAVQTIRAELDLALLFAPPPFLGVPPSGPDSPDSSFTRSQDRFFGPRKERPKFDPDRVLGNPGARGAVTARARVVRTLEEASALQPGEILVTKSTMPPWSPLFAIAAGVVTETGGPLSHCAIVAREYGIPAVVGAAGAMERIANGQSITIDGSTGIVDLRG